MNTKPSKFIPSGWGRASIISWRTFGSPVLGKGSRAQDSGPAHSGCKTRTRKTHDSITTKPFICYQSQNYRITRKWGFVFKAFFSCVVIFFLNFAQTFKKQPARLKIVFFNFLAIFSKKLFWYNDFHAIKFIVVQHTKGCM